MGEKKWSLTVRLLVTILLTVMYWWLLYNEREIPRLLEWLWVVAIGIALVGAEPMLVLLSKRVDKWTK